MAREEGHRRRVEELRRGLEGVKGKQGEKEESYERIARRGVYDRGGGVTQAGSAFQLFPHRLTASRTSCMWREYFQYGFKTKSKVQAFPTQRTGESLSHSTAEASALFLFAGYLLQPFRFRLAHPVGGKPSPMMTEARILRAHSHFRQQKKQKNKKESNNKCSGVASVGQLLKH